MKDDDLKKSIAEYLISCPVYRFYDNEFSVMEMDKGKDRQKLRSFYTRCMQFTGPLMAKGVEDTLMYTFNRFIGHNEVGDSPDLFGYSVQQFHQMMLYRSKHWPYSMNGTSTHDTKRGEDVRARLNAMSDLYDEWITVVQQWRKDFAGEKSNAAPDNNDEYFVYQTIAGSYPLTGPHAIEGEIEKYAGRLKEYFQKALREAKRHTNWSEPNAEYEDAVIRFAQHVAAKNTEALHPFIKKITDYGMINSLGQLVLKFTCPGMPDTYQGTELWDLSLVDPDNRRPVDFHIRNKMAGEQLQVADLWKNRNSGQIKLKILKDLLKIRNNHHKVFSEGRYIPLQIEGTFKDNLIAFVRMHHNKYVLVAVSLHYPSVNGKKPLTDDLPVADWQDTKIILPEGAGSAWHNLLNGKALNANGSIDANIIFQEIPVAILGSDKDSDQ